MGEESWHPKPGEVIAGKWEIAKKLGQGAFGAVYEVRDRNGGSDPGACKVEHVGAMVHVLKWEVVVMKQLTQSGAKHFTMFLDCGRSPKGDFAFLCMPMVGANLEKLREKLPPDAGQRFSLRTVLHIGIETVMAMRELHDCGYLHRDVKPENFAIGRPPATRRIVLLDLGMVRQWRKADGQIHTPRKIAVFRGNLKYASINALRQNEQSRRDDLWAWFYQTIEMTAGALPWPAWIDAPDVQGQLDGFAKAKEAIHNEAGKLTAMAPREFNDIYKHLDGLRYASEPDYELLKAALMRTYDRKEYKDHMKLDCEEGGQYFAQTRMVPYDNRC